MRLRPAAREGDGEDGEGEEDERDGFPETEIEHFGEGDKVACTPHVADEWHIARTRRRGRKRTGSIVDRKLLAQHQRDDEQREGRHDRSIAHDELAKAAEHIDLEGQIDGSVAGRVGPQLEGETVGETLASQRRRHVRGDAVEVEVGLLDVDEEFGLVRLVEILADQGREQLSFAVASLVPDSQPIGDEAGLDGRDLDVHDERSLGRQGQPHPGRQHAGHAGASLDLRFHVVDEFGDDPAGRGPRGLVDDRDELMFRDVFETVLQMDKRSGFVERVFRRSGRRRQLDRVAGRVFAGQPGRAGALAGQIHVHGEERGRLSDVHREDAAEEDLEVARLARRVEALVREQREALASTGAGVGGHWHQMRLDPLRAAKGPLHEAFGLGQNGVRLVLQRQERRGFLVGERLLRDGLHPRQKPLPEEAHPVGARFGLTGPVHVDDVHDGSDQDLAKLIAPEDGLVIHASPHPRHRRGEDGKAMRFGHERGEARVVRRDDGVQAPAGDRDQRDVPQRIVVRPLLRVRLPPVVVDAGVGPDDLAVECDWRAGVGRGDGEDGVDRVGLVVGHREHRPCHDAAHRVSDQDDRGRIREASGSHRPLRVMVQRQDEGDRLVEVFGLVQQSLAVEGRDVLIEVDREEIEAAGPGIERGRIEPNDLLEILGGLGGDGPNLLVAPRVAWYEEDRNTFDLRFQRRPGSARTSQGKPRRFALYRFSPRLTLVSSSTPPSLYRYSEYLLAKRVCSVSKSLNFANAGRMYDILHPGTSRWRETTER